MGLFCNEDVVKIDTSVSRIFLSSISSQAALYMFLRVTPFRLW
jgi:hypothetical protein